MAGQSVLVVDDEKRLTEFFQNFFTKLGYQMQVALSGEEALKAVEQNQPALVLLDMRMPGVDGVQVLKTVKERFPKVKVVVMTSYDEEYRKAADQYHADAFFPKPPGLADLTRKIEELLKPDDPPEQAAVLETPPELVPKARLLFIGFGKVSVFSIEGALHRVGQGSLPPDEADDEIKDYDETKDYPDAGLYEWDEATTRKEVLQKLKEQRPDFVFILVDWFDHEVGFFETRRVTASDVVAEMLRSKYAPKDVFVISGGSWDYTGQRAQEEKSVETGGSLLEEPFWLSPDFEKQSAKISRILWEKCKKFGLMTKRPEQGGDARAQEI